MQVLLSYLLVGLVKNSLDVLPELDHLSLFGPQEKHVTNRACNALDQARNTLLRLVFDPLS